MRGPNTDRFLDADHVSVAWVDLPDTLTNAFPSLPDDDREALSDIWADHQHGLSDAAEISYLQAQDQRAQAVRNLEEACEKLARAIEALPDQAELLDRAFNLLAAAQIGAKQSWPEKVSTAVLSVADVKTQTARRLIAFAADRGMDAKALVTAMGIHTTHSAEAWQKWFARCAAT